MSAPLATGRRTQNQQPHIVSHNISWQNRYSAELLGECFASSLWLPEFSKMRSNRILISLLVGALTAISLVGVIVHAFTSAETKSNDILHYVVVLLGIFFISEVVARCFAETFSQQESETTKAHIKQFVDDIHNATARTSEIVVFPTNIVAFDYLASNINRAISVNNTILRYGSERAVGPYGDIYAHWMREKSKSIVGGAQWNEIISCHLKFTDEQADIVRNYEQQGQFYDSTLIDDREHQMMQVTTIIYREGVREVLFGFHYPGWLSAPAFLSRDRNVFEFFQNYYQVNFHRCKERQQAERHETSDRRSHSTAVIGQIDATSSAVSPTSQSLADPLT